MENLLNTLNELEYDDRTKDFYVNLEYLIDSMVDTYEQVLSALQQSADERNTSRIFRQVQLIIEDANKLSKVLNATPQLKKKEPWFRTAFNNLKSAKDLRNTLQHINQEITKNSIQNLPAIGTIQYTSVINRSEKKLAVSMIANGNIKAGAKIPLNFPGIEKMRDEIDHVMLLFGENYSNVSDLYYTVRSLKIEIRATLEKKLKNKS